jgi:CRP-like cAMP-binding protein
MEQKFSNNGINLRMLREFCEGEGELVEYRKGDQMEREGDPSRWFGYVTEGCFKYVNHGISDDKEHITWFSFAGEFVTDYPTFLYGRPSQTTIVAMMPSRVLRVTGQQLEQFFNQSKDTMKLRAFIAEHILFQFRSRYLDLHCATARERYELLLRRCPGIVHHLALQDLASFLCVTPNYLSTIRKDITFETKK